MWCLETCRMMFFSVRLPERKQSHKVSNELLNKFLDENPFSCLAGIQCGQFWTPELGKIF